ncbi:MAG: RluA family pseudouridine synthase, partial [Planctomycetaceae bacterium]
MLTVLYEDNHCLAVCKPARLLTMGDQTDDETLVEQARQYLKTKYQKPGNVFVGVVHRLDRPVSGVVLLARTSKGAARLSEQFREGTVTKTYTALVTGKPLPGPVTWHDWLWKETGTNRVRCVTAGTVGARESSLECRPLGRAGGLQRVEVRPITGRSHQIRVPLSAPGLPLSGASPSCSPVPFLPCFLSLPSLL